MKALNSLFLVCTWAGYKLTLNRWVLGIACLGAGVAHGLGGIVPAAVVSIIIILIGRKVLQVVVMFRGEW